MTTCLSCGRWNDRLCPTCRSLLHPAPDRWIEGGLLVRSLYVHENTAARLVHRLKYGGIAAVADLIAPAMAELLPADAEALVPVPRTWWRRVRHGIDAAVEISRAVSNVSGIPVARVLTAPVVAPRHAGRDRRHRLPVGFWTVGEIPSGAVLVDDVVTTGATLASAHRALHLGPRHALTITAALGVTSLSSGHEVAHHR